MGFFDLFRKKIENIEKDKVKTLELGGWVNRKKQENSAKEYQFIKLIKSKISLLESELNENLNVLENLDINEKKAEERVKFIVKENVDQYVDYVKRFMLDLNKLDDSSPSDFVDGVKFALNKFEKRSSLNYHKATVLIGKEMGEVKRTISSFFDELNKLLENNKNLINSSKTICLIDKKLKEREDLEGLKERVQESVEGNERKIGLLKEKIKSLKNQICKLLESPDYLMNLKKKETLEKKQIELERELSNLKNNINFKNLMQIFHTSEKNMDIIKIHKNNFVEAFSKDNGEKILGLLNESNLFTDEISNLFDLVLDKKNEVDEIVIDEDETLSLEQEIERIKNEIDSLVLGSEREHSKINKFDQSIKEIEDFIGFELENINVELIS